MVVVVFGPSLNKALCRMRCCKPLDLQTETLLGSYREGTGTACKQANRGRPKIREQKSVVAHDCGYPLSRYTCRATRVAADFLDLKAFCRCSTGVALHPLKILVSHLPPPPGPGGVAPKFGSEKVSRYTGVSQLQLRVSRYTVQLSRKGT